jgi:AraC-like DNA-binding protein
MEAVKERIKSRYDKYLEQIEFLRRVSVTKPYSRHYAHKYIIGISLAGAGRIEYRNTFIEGAGRSIYVLEPGETWGSQTKNLTYQHFYVEPALLQRIATEIHERERPLPHFRFPTIIDTSLYTTLHDLYTKFTSPTSPFQQWEMLFHAFGQLLLAHSENHGTPRHYGWERPAIKRVKAYLDEHYAEEISLEDLARIANLSAFHLTRVFRQAVGLPPHAYQAQIRLDHARRLLAQGFSVSYVASETGFFDQAHFTHQFKRALGVTPGNYMKTTRIYRYTYLNPDTTTNHDELQSVFSASSK